MSAIKANRHQIGNNATTSKNIVLEADAVTGDLIINKGVHDGTLTELYRFPNGGGLRDTVSVKDYEHLVVGDDWTGAIQAALNSGFLIVDFLGIACKCDTVTVPAGVAAINLNLIKKTAGGNVVLVNSNCRLTGKIAGTGTLSVVERGVYVAANNVCDVVFDLELVNLTYGIHGQPISGTAYSDSPKRWSGDLKFTNIAGTTGASEGYGLLLSPSSECSFNIVSKSPNARHIVYLAAGASNNQIDAVIDGCTNYAAQIFSVSPQPNCEYNILKLTCKNLTETVPGSSGAIAIVGQSNYNTVQFTVTGGNAISYGAFIEGQSGGPYPTGNKIIDSAAYGQFTGGDVIRMVNADSTIVSGNTLSCYGTSSVIGMRRTGTNNSAHGGYIENNVINGLAQNVKGIYNELTAQPSYIGPNVIINNGTSLRVDDATSGKRYGYSKYLAGRSTSGSIAAGSFGNVSLTFPDAILYTTRSIIAVTDGGSLGTYGYSNGIAIFHDSDTTATIRISNGGAGAQTFAVNWAVYGD